MSLKRFINQSRPFIEMQHSDTVIEAIDQMIQLGAGAVLVLHEGDGVRGIFTEHDIMVKVVAEGRDPGNTPLCEVMTTEVVTMPAASSLDSAIRMMGKNGIRHLPVADKEDNVIGMISLRHLLHEKIEMVIDELNALEAYDNDALGG